MLFNEKLGIRNANWTDYLDALLQFKISEPPDLQGKVLQVYEFLRSSRLSEEDLLSLLWVTENFQDQGVIANQVCKDYIR